jgi:hypothetical protein
VEHYFTIADVLLNIRTNKILLPEYIMHNNVLRQFFSAHRPDQVENEVEVYITDAPAPDFKSGIKIFDSNSSFAIYSYANDNYVVDKFLQEARAVKARADETAADFVNEFIDG